MSSFVIFGNLELPFVRMATSVKDSYAHFPKPVKIQAGVNQVYFADAPEGVEVFDRCSYSEFESIVRNSSVIVTHGGVGAIKEAILAGLYPAVFVRDASRREHIDDHQVDWCNTLFASRIATEVRDARDLREFLGIATYRQHDIGFAQAFFDDSKLTASLHSLIRKVLADHEGR